MKANRLFFAPANRKLRRLASIMQVSYGEIFSFSLPAGFTCPAAKLCKSYANRQTGKVVDAMGIQYRCYAASMESRYPHLRAINWKNFDLIKALDKYAIIYLILQSIPEKSKIIRIHISGDFYSEDYFLAWFEVARLRPDILFYGYTKRLDLWVKHMQDIPKNLIFTASKGGIFDNLIDEHKLKSSQVVFSRQEADRAGLEVSDNEECALIGKTSFALLIHGCQPANSQAAMAVNLINRDKMKG